MRAVAGAVLAARGRCDLVDTDGRTAAEVGKGGVDARVDDVGMDTGAVRAPRVGVVAGHRPLVDAVEAHDGVGDSGDVMSLART